MLIRSFGTSVANVDEPNIRKTALGIYGVNRIIYIFLNKNDYDTKCFTHCKACIINNVVYDTKHDYSHPIQIDGGIIIRNAIYFGDIYLELQGVLKSGWFIVNNCTTTESVRMPNGHTLSISPSTWSKRLYEISDRDTAELLYNDNLCGCETMTLNPVYYTDYEMNAKNGEFVDMVYENNHKYLMSDLIDKNTHIIYMNVSKYDTMRLNLAKQMPKVESICEESFNISNGLKSAFSSFVGQGSTFIYDSDAQGVNKSGMNVKGGVIPFGKHYHQKYLTDNLNGAMSLFELECKDIEKQMGHIRVFYNPSSISDKMKIKFKDYIKSPIVVPNQINNDGSVNINLSNSSPLSSIDNGYVTDSYVKNVVNTQYENEIENFNKNLFLL